MPARSRDCPHLGDKAKAVVSEHVPPRPLSPFRPTGRSPRSPCWPLTQASAWNTAAPAPPKAEPSHLHSEAHLRASPKPPTCPLPHPTLPQSLQPPSTVWPPRGLWAKTETTLLVVHGCKPRAAQVPDTESGSTDTCCPWNDWR